MAEHTNSLPGFTPEVERWFASVGKPTPPQLRGWERIRSGDNTLIAAPTGSGKTLAAFLCAIDDLVRESKEAPLPEETRVLYISPLKALSADIDANLARPLNGVDEELELSQNDMHGITTGLRTGDTAPHVRQRQVAHPPHIFVTTPESLYILLTSEKGRRMLGTVRTVIIDEIHAMIADKRGSHLALSLERLDRVVCGNGHSPPQRVGLSATQRPVELVSLFLGGTHGPCQVVDEGHLRELDLAIEIPDSPLETVMSHEVWSELFGRISEMAASHRTTLIFVNTRKLAERVAKDLTPLLGEDSVTSHHGSLSRKHRHEAERRLRAGELRALVATASLELGIDIGDVDLVCQIGSTRTISAFLQRAGRAGHQVGGTSKARLFPLSRDELIESIALFKAVERGELDHLEIPEAPLDILAQQMVAELACNEMRTDELFALVRGAFPYQRLTRKRFDSVVEMLAEGFNTRRGRRGAYIHLDRINGKVRGRRHARISAITGGGAIPEVADYEVLLEPAGARVGTVNEDFAIESLAGDIFQLGNTSYQIRKVEPGKVRVTDAKGKPPTIPFWLGEAPSRSRELSLAVSALRETFENELTSGGSGDNALVTTGVDNAALRQARNYLHAAKATLGHIPTARRIVAERFFDEAGDTHIVIHCPLGSRINRAWGLALRKRFCRTFNFELQAAATENAIILSLGPTHSFPLHEVFDFLHPNTVRKVLTQAMLASPFFENRWRWNATRSLAVLRFQSGKKVPPPLQRMRSDDLLTTVFPDQVACAENLAGDREIPEHPLVQETVDNCLHEAMDIEGLEQLLREIKSGDVQTIARDLTEPSPLALEVLNAAPYAFLDDAPLEERRTQAVMSRRWLDPATASDLGALDADAIARVRSEAWPTPRDSDELHEFLYLSGALLPEELEPYAALMPALVNTGRAVRVVTDAVDALWIATERLSDWRSAHPHLRIIDGQDLPRELQRSVSGDHARTEIVRAYMDFIGPVTAPEIQKRVGFDPRAALAQLEREGAIMRGHFETRDTEEASETAGMEEQWCERRLLARIHRYTVERLRREIEPVDTATFVRFLMRHQHVHPDTRMAGVEGLFAVLEQLEGYEVPTQGWESQVLKARMRAYEPAFLDQLCMEGRVTWFRRTGSSNSPIRTTPIAIVPRISADVWRRSDPTPESDLGSNARDVLNFLRTRGASFFLDVQAGVGLLATHTEAALAELVAKGLAHSDSFAGMRVILLPEYKRRESKRRGRRRAAVNSLPGRWAALAHERPDTDEALEHIANVLLDRWGVLFRRVLEGERGLPPWRDLLYVLRRMELRGEIRGGRFVEGHSGEQFATREAIAQLRQVRLEQPTGNAITLAACDPLAIAAVLCGQSKALRGKIVLLDGQPAENAVGPLN